MTRVCKSPLSVALSLLVALFISYTAKGDVTGYFETHISLTPQTTGSELSLIEFDFENDLTVTVSVSGLSSTLHSHLGIAGVEDLQLTLAATLGDLDISSNLVLGRFASGSTAPYYDELRFLKKIVVVDVSLAGVTFTNLATFEDTAAFVSQTPAFAFGDVVTISGQTQSGITITAQTGFCMEQEYNIIKKHTLSPFSVNPDCATTPKPDVLFDFENLAISGVPLALGVLGEVEVECIQVIACTLTQTISLSGGLIPFSASVTFSDLFSLTLGSVTVTLIQGPGTITVVFAPSGTISSISIILALTLNPDTNPATLRVSASGTPGAGITSAVVSLSITRAELTFTAFATFSGSGGSLEFSRLTVRAQAQAGLVTLELATAFEIDGLDDASLTMRVNF